MTRRAILTLACPDRPGIVAEVATFLFRSGLNVAESGQFFDRATGRFFMRVVAEAIDARVDLAALQAAFAEIATPWAMEWTLRDADARVRVLLMVSRFGHCLNDLLYRFSIGALPIVVPAVVSNHWDSYQRVAALGVPFHHLPVTPDTKGVQEVRLRDLITQHEIELIVLARYMQVLSPQFCGDFPGRIINIHHSFLPSFKGAKPYHQAHMRGVKLIGATAHYVTQDLDEGPIIEQEVARCDHADEPDDLAALGRDVEAHVLARAIKAHVESRVLLNGRKTVVFR